MGQILGKNEVPFLQNNAKFDVRSSFGLFEIAAIFVISGP
jgi:hypothetical protein